MKENKMIDIIPEEKDPDSFRNPPLENVKGQNKVLKKIGDSITIKQLKDHLGLISWDLSHRGCGHYYIINHKHEMTNLQVRDSNPICLELCNKSDVFGKSETGFISFDLKYMEIELSHGDTLFLSCNDDKSSCQTFFFTNYDKPFTKAEEYINSKEKLYVCKRKCSDCGKVLTESVHMSGVEVMKNSFLMGFSGVLATKPCSNKNCRSTFSDYNMNTDNIWYKVKTNRHITYDRIEEIHSKEKSEYNKIVRGNKNDNA